MCLISRSSNNGTAPKKYIEKTIDGYTRIFNHKPSTKYKSPLEKGDHPDRDTIELLYDDGIQKYQFLIGLLQWLVSIGRIYIAVAVIPLSSYRSTPRIGHLRCAKILVSYLSKMKEVKLRFCVCLLDYSDISYVQYDWEILIYGVIKGYLPYDNPITLIYPVVMTHYIDVNL